MWTRAANYHSRTPQYNAVYRAAIMRRAAKWGAWLQARFVTVDATTGKPLPLGPQPPAKALSQPATL